MKGTLPVALEGPDPFDQRADYSAGGFIMGAHKARCAGETYTDELNITLVEINKLNHSLAHSLRGERRRQDGGLRRATFQGHQGLPQPSPLDDPYASSGRAH